MDSSATPAPLRRAKGGLTARELVVLQLLAVGYSPTQVDTLLEATGATQRALRAARSALGRAGLARVLDEARLRGLIT